MRIVIPRSARLSVGVVLVAVGLVGAVRAVDPAGNAVSAGVPSGFDKVIEDNANRMVREGRQTFRFDTFGDEAFWGDALQLHKAIAGEKHGGVGAIVSLAPNLKPFTDLLGVDLATVKAVLASWGPGRFDAELDKDGKALRPDGKQAGTLLPPAFGLAGVNLHTWTGFGSVTYWNAYVGATEMHGSGTFFDARLSNGDQYPVAARSGSGNTRGVPDRLTAKLAALHFYQLSIPAPKALVGSFSAAAASRGKALFDGRARCASCHVPPLFTEPGNNLHAPAEIGVDAFQADRSKSGGT